MAEGNYLGKRRKNFFLSRDCCDMIVELSQLHGHSESAVIETAIRMKYADDTKYKGVWPIKGPFVTTFKS